MRNALAVDLIVGKTAGMDYLDTDAVADLLGLKVETVRMHHYRRTMPAPDATFGRSPVWKRETIAAWDATRRKNESARKGTTEAEA